MKHFMHWDLSQKNSMVSKNSKVIDFMKHRSYFIISAVVIIAGFVGMGVYGSSTGKALSMVLNLQVEHQQLQILEKNTQSQILKNRSVVSEVTGDSNIRLQQ